MSPCFETDRIRKENVPSLKEQKTNDVYLRVGSIGSERSLGKKKKICLQKSWSSRTSEINYKDFLPKFSLKHCQED